MSAATNGSLALPQNVEAEAALLGAMMLDNRVADQVADQLDPDDFFEALHGRIYATICGLRAKDLLATPVTLRPYFETDAGMLELGIGYLGRLTGSGAGLIGFHSLARQIRDLALHRAIAIAGRDLTARALDTSAEVNPRAILEEGERLLANVSGRDRTETGVVDLGTAWRATMKNVRAVQAGEVSVGAMIAGLAEWNEITGGMTRGQFIILGGRPGMGKTDVALSVARRAAEAGHGVLFISREMHIDQLMLRIVADMMMEAGSRATFEDLRCGRLSEADYELADTIGQRVEAWPLAFEYAGQLNAASVRPMIKKHQRRFEKRGQKLGLAVLDYIGLLDPPQPRGNREQEMSDISRTLKDAAMSCEVPLLALAQINRGVEQREDKRPVISDLRDSGSLEQDADAVLFVYRAEYYLGLTPPDASDVKKREAWEIDKAAARNRIEIYADKSRQIEKQSRTLYFFGSNHAIRSDDHYRAGRHTGA